ncbi:carbamoyl phosphate synthase small subunit, partial [Candidatus Gracilibacteria bacterium]|nr:carbamoyl phosphate synthase small subunit [Candidatus Gracilibacteria bacterium]
RFVPEVSPKTIEILEPKNPTGKSVAFIDCGAKNGIFRNFLKRGIRVIRVPFDQDPFELNEKFDGIFFSNGPGDPEAMTETIEMARKAMHRNIPMFGICLGCQMFGLAAGGKTQKMKYGHRSVNQPVQDVKNDRCLITTQNHGFMVDEGSLPSDYEVWFKNLNDGSVEGIRHKTKPISAVQFHPEACAGPEDGEYLFDEFVKQLGKISSLVGRSRKTLRALGSKDQGFRSKIGMFVIANPRRTRAGVFYCAGIGRPKDKNRLCRILSRNQTKRPQILRSRRV